MPRKTNTELILEIRDTAANLDVRMKQLEQQVRESEEQWQRKFDLLTEIDKRLAVLQSKFDELQKTQDKWDNQRWMVMMALLGSFLTLVVNVVISLMRR